MTPRPGGEQTVDRGGAGNEGGSAVAVRTAVDRFPASARCRNAATGRAYAGVLDRVAERVGADRPLTGVAGKGRWRNPRTAMRYVRPGAAAPAEVTELFDIAPRQG